MPSTGEADPLVLECRRGAGASSAIGEKGGASWLDHLTATTGPADSTFRNSRRNSCAEIPRTGNNTPGSPAMAVSPRDPQLAVEWPGRGAWNFPIDPERSALTDPAIWRSDLNARVVILTGDESHCDDVEAARSICDVIAEQRGPDKHHLVLAGADGRHRLLVIASSQQSIGGYLVPRDGSLPIRLAALEAFHACVGGKIATAARHRLLPTAYQSHRLHLLLAILDVLGMASNGKVTLRDMASKLVYRGLAHERAIDWKSSSQRRHTQRLVAEAHRMASRGYRDLLNTDRPRPFQSH